MWKFAYPSFLAAGFVHSQVDVLPFVNPLIGTINGGHVFPGATLPFGMAKAVADVGGSENQGGFASDGSPVKGFSHMHDDGTGGAPSLGNFPLWIEPQCKGDVPSGCKYVAQDRQVNVTQGSVVAEPGYFALSLTNGIKAEMTVSNHTALYRFTLPGNATGPLLLSEVADLPNSARDGTIQVDPATGRMTGNATFSPSFGVGSYKLNFCADFRGGSVRDAGVWDFIGVKTNKTFIKGAGTGSGAWLRLKNMTSNVVLARVGVSFMSVDQACRNAEREIPQFGFANIRKNARAAWAKKFSVVSVGTGGVGTDLQTVFWSGIYRTLISPQDYTGENYLWQSTEPYYDSFYCGWDSFRSVHPLITLLDPESQALMVRSLIDVYRNEGWLPDCRMSLCKGFTQGGSNADVILVDSYLKNITNGIDWNTGYEALIKDAEVQSREWGEEGRGGLAPWKSVGYIPFQYRDTGDGYNTRSISRTVEYAYDDFCIAEMAKRMGKVDDYNKYMNRSHNWKNLFKADTPSSIKGQDTGFTGFLQPKYQNGTWGYQDPIFCSPLLEFDACYLNPNGHETYEGSCWMYSFFVPGDTAQLIKTLGGPETFVKRLDYLHESGLLYVGDEQSFINVFLYHYAGRPGKSALRSHYYIPSQFNTTLNGIPGNDDSGAMGSFSTLCMMGIFPNPGQNVYFITPPFFESVSLTSPQTGKTATIKNINFDTAYKNIYIQSARLNGKKYTKNWLDHSFFMNGGTLELTLGPTESKWGTRQQDLPPSLSTTGMYV